MSRERAHLREAQRYVDACWSEVVECEEDLDTLPPDEPEPEISWFWCEEHEDEPDDDCPDCENVEDVFDEAYLAWEKNEGEREDARIEILCKLEPADEAWRDALVEESIHALRVARLPRDTLGACRIAPTQTS